MQGESSGRSGPIRLDFARGPWVCESPRFLEPRLSRFLPVPRPAPGLVALGLPLGIWQTLAQPARQHLRFSGHFLSELHSRVQFRSSCSFGHTPAFLYAVFVTRAKPKPSSSRPASREATSGPGRQMEPGKEAENASPNFPCPAWNQRHADVGRSQDYLL